MFSPHPQRPSADEVTRDQIARLDLENAQLRQAVGSHAVIDQAIGVLIAVHQVSPAGGWEVLRQVSQRCNIKLSVVAEGVIGWVLGEPMPPQVRQELEGALQRFRQERPESGGQAQVRGSSSTAGEATGHQGDSRSGD
ncbi:ANTAR domain-containing protein [Streptomyces venetus]|uniref:ANTAR domain-containing protein n=1 Tax=Streptomyces venetus TaxID=1701086 RepID=UPI003C2AAE90